MGQAVFPTVNCPPRWDLFVVPAQLAVPAVVVRKRREHTRKRKISKTLGLRDLGFLICRVVAALGSGVLSF